MRIIPHSLAAAMLAGILLRFGLDAFTLLQGHFLLSVSMLISWQAMKLFAPRCTVVAALLVTMASQNGSGLTTLKASGYEIPVSPLMVITGLIALLLAPFVFFLSVSPRSLPRGCFICLRVCLTVQYPAC